MYEVYNNMGIETQRYWLGNLTIGNEDKGLMTVIEVITEDYVEYKYKTDEGNLYKPEKTKVMTGADLQYIDEDERSYEEIFDSVKTTHTDEIDKQRLIATLKKIKFAEKPEEIEANFFDLDKVIKMVAINKALSNIDGFTGKIARNYFLYERDGKIDILTYDFNMSLGVNPEQFFWKDEDVETFELIEYEEKEHSIIVDIIVENEEYYQKYREYIGQALEELEKINISDFVEEEKVENIQELKEFIENRINEFYVEEYLQNTRITY